METSSQIEEPGVDPISVKHSVQLSTCNGVWALLVPFPSAKHQKQKQFGQAMQTLCGAYSANKTKF